MAKLERDFQKEVVQDIRKKHPQWHVLIPDPHQYQGFPDIIVLSDTQKWAALEVKRSDKEKFQPNQEYYIETLDRVGFAKVIHPGNKEEVLDELQRSLEN